MIGIFDSGVGGLTALKEIRKIAPSVDVCFLKDEKNAPYGTKSEKELIRLVSHDVERLLSEGCDGILMACCTASAVISKLPQRLALSATPIIPPAAREAARLTENGHVGVIATESTVAMGAFQKELEGYKSVRSCTALATQELVKLAEENIRNLKVTRKLAEAVYRIVKPLRDTDIDTLIMGCTHFPHFAPILHGIFPRVRLVNPSLEGAKMIMKKKSRLGKGVTLYLR